ncbi:MAG TPA: site-specific DNA-methyltransferase [Gemmataceae bacterium]|jgi:site-specific DNA-methyltransferase (cytosine-N4-specific)
MRKDRAKTEAYSANIPRLGIVPAYTTRWGSAYHADALDVLRGLPSNSVSLVLTSPPFALRRKKAYGNVAAAEYVEWLAPFAEQIHRVIRPDGSFVLELGGSWNSGIGTRSLYQYEVILRLARLFHVAQDFYWYNPSRLPTPAEWVTVRRTRVKDAVSLIWWLSKTENPQADNRRVLRPYSRSMRRLLKNGYKTAKRPSQHDISANFARDNGGAIPPNLLSIANTRSNDDYLRRCRDAGLPIHPARFPPTLPEFFIRFLTEPGQLVFDPFAGSNITGQVAEALGRSWISSELNADYVEGSRLRFPNAAASSGRTDSLAG